MPGKFDSISHSLSSQKFEQIQDIGKINQNKIGFIIIINNLPEKVE